MKRFNPYHILACLLLFPLIVLVFTDIRFFEPDEWTYYFTAKNFANHDFSITHQQYKQQKTFALKHARKYNKHHFTQYRLREDGRYISEKPAGYPLVVCLLQALGLEKLPNLLLYAAAVLALYLLPDNLFIRRERLCMAVLLAVCPLVLISLSRFYMADFFAFALTAVGVSFVLNSVYRAPSRWSLPFAALAGACLAYSGFCRITNYAFLPVTGVFLLLHLWHRRSRRVVFLLLAFCLGAGVVLLVNALYNQLVLGGLLLTPYRVGAMALKIPQHCFAFQYLYAGKPQYPLLIIGRNLVKMPQILLLAMPAGIFLLPGLARALRMKRPRLLLYLLLLLAAVFGLFLQFYRVSTTCYLWNARPYLQGFLPIAMIGGLFFSDLNRRKTILLLLVMVLLGYALFFTFLYDNHQDPFGLGIAPIWNIKRYSRLTK